MAIAINSEIIEAGIKSGVRSGAAELAEKEAKELIEKLLKESIQQLAQEAAEKTAKEVAIQAAKDLALRTAKSTSKEFAAKAAKYVVAGVVVAGVAVYIAGRVTDLDGSKYGITSIKNHKKGILITFTPGVVLNKDGDTLTFSQTNCVPVLSGEKSIVEVPDKTSVVVAGGPLTTDGTTGSMVLNTTFESQMDMTLQEAGNSVGSTVGKSTAAVTKAGANVFTSLFDGLGLNANTLKIGSSILCCILSLIIVIMVFLKS